VEDDEARTALLNYLQRNPSAADTLKGIVRWWLTDIKGKVSEEGVEYVLEKLITEGLIRKSMLADGTTLYSRSVVNK
jgi:hypothetical protein